MPALQFLNILDGIAIALMTEVATLEIKVVVYFSQHYKSSKKIFFHHVNKRLTFGSFLFLIRPSYPPPRAPWGFFVGNCLLFEWLSPSQFDPTMNRGRVTP